MNSAAIAEPLPSRALLERIRAEMLAGRQDASPPLHWPGAEVRRFRDDLYTMTPLPSHDPTRRYRWDFREPLSPDQAGGVLSATAVTGRGLRVADGDSNSPHIKGLSHSAIQTMYSYHWPGNVREMNSIRRALVMSEGPLILPDDLGLERRGMRRCVTTLEEARRTAEKAAIRNAFEQAGGNLTHVAEYLGTSRGTLYRLLDKYAISWPGRVSEDEHPAMDKGDQSSRIPN